MLPRKSKKPLSKPLLSDTSPAMGYEAELRNPASLENSASSIDASSILYGSDDDTAGNNEQSNLGIPQDCHPHNRYSGDVPSEQQQLHDLDLSNDQQIDVDMSNEQHIDVRRSRAEEDLDTSIELSALMSGSSSQHAWLKMPAALQHSLWNLWMFAIPLVAFIICFEVRHSRKPYEDNVLPYDLLV